MVSGPQPAAGSDSGQGALERAVPTEIITFYTAIIAACQTVLAHDDTATFPWFRLAVFVVGLIATAYAAGRAVQAAVPGWTATMKSPEWWTATLSFAAWGLALPGSILYVWLDANALTITVATITAAAGLVIAVVLTPRLAKREPPTAAPGPALTNEPPIRP
jgi:hypothetical protein